MKKDNLAKVYRLYFQFASATVIAAFLGVLSCIGLWLIGMGLIGQSAQLAMFGTVLSSVLGAFWYHLLCVTITIVTHSETGDIEFVGLMSKRRAHATEIISIKPDPAYGSNLVVALASGSKVPLYHGHFDGFHEFLTWLKGVNPAVELRGC